MSSQRAHRWSVYVLRCGDGSLYTGIATDVARRLEEHRSGSRRGSKYLRGRGPLALVLEKPVGARSLALKIERRLKRLSKQRKEDLIHHRGRVESLLDPTSQGDSLRRRRRPENGNTSAAEAQMDPLVCRVTRSASKGRPERLRRPQR